jgi:hypothetical protein
MIREPRLAAALTIAPIRGGVVEFGLCRPDAVA